MSEFKPKARQSDIVVQEFGNELLIYDLKTDKALALNQTSALVWRLCDGKNTIAEIADKMAASTKLLITSDLVCLALEELRKENLLKAETIQLKQFEGLSRREIVKKIGFASMVSLPLISSLVAPVAVNAASCVGLGSPGNVNGCPCSANPNCTSTCCGVEISGNEVCVALDATPLGSPCRGNCECAGSSTCPSCAGFPRVCRTGPCPPSP